ncbi:hypothetical protein GCM10011376_20390 [Nocardioides flavus (ex Wang et al. 2016)]|uniref:DUF3515 domain-containing protein n=1 Tax=Nocardioides flavus (ex Wang et al. 2016) TaxID=2058780 RepID=A0ABQ3HMS9_9ACTN|nr:DUF3515 domain-containing protein [Nocardioides flavus (ex Wang et al. 2016)]GHE17429.1 hypothetical protein GCM10011376_20390 [Nocardioides flavus (ex Wang et al. 2016)]
MPPVRRLGSTRSRGVVASAVLALAALVLAGCSSTITIDDQDLSGADRAACEALVADLPEKLAGQDRVDVEPDGALGAAWGDPAYVLTCGVPQPSDYEPTAECSVIAGIGWYVPDDQLTDQGEDATPIALSRTPYVQVLVPAERRTEGIDRALAELAPVLEDNLGEGLPCL